MSNLAWLVLDDESKLDQILEAWERVGVRGATILESTGLARRRGYNRGDMPLFPSVSTLLQSGKDRNVSLFALLADDGVTPQQLLAATEAVTGDLSTPHTGLFFVLPISFSKGTQMAEERD